MQLINTPIVIEDLLKRVELPKDGTLSVTIEQSPHMKVVLFGFAAGQELSEHTASVPAIMHQLSGEAHWQVGDKSVDAKPGTWVSMPAKLSHSITATTPSVMLLMMIKGAKEESAACSCGSE